MATVIHAKQITGTGQNGDEGIQHLPTIQPPNGGPISQVNIFIPTVRTTTKETSPTHEQSVDVVPAGADAQRKVSVPTFAAGLGEGGSTAPSRRASVKVLPGTKRASVSSLTDTQARQIQQILSQPTTRTSLPRTHYRQPRLGTPGGDLRRSAPPEDDGGAGGGADADNEEVVGVARARLSTIPTRVGVAAVSLRVLDLHGNALTNLSPLRGCIHLVKLDAHGNRLQALPGAAFWAGLRRLRVLYLHDNALSGRHGAAPAVQALAGARTLNLLTLFGTPLARVRGYRTYVINVLWSLWALDGHLVSDGEIIEGAQFCGMHAPLSPLYAFATYAPCRPERELLAVYTLLANACLRQRKVSPVHILQRFWRRVLRARPLPRTTTPPQATPPQATPTDTAGATDAENPEKETFEPFKVDRTQLVTRLMATLARQSTTPQSEYLQWVQHDWLGQPRQQHPSALLASAFSGPRVALPTLERPRGNFPAPHTPVVDISVTDSVIRGGQAPDALHNAGAQPPDTNSADAQGTASVRSPTEPAVANHEPTSSDETLGSRTAIRDVLEKPSTTQVDNFPASPTNCKHALVPGGRVSSSRSDGGPTYLRPLTTEATHRVRQGQRHAERQAQNRQRQQKILAAEARAREARREHDTQKQAAAREYHMRHRNVIQSHQKAIAQEVDDLKRAHEHVVAERLSTREAAVARVQAEVEAKRRDRQQWVDAHAQEAHQAKTEADMLRRAQARRQRKQQQEIKHAVHAYLQQLRDATARTRTRQRRAVWSQATARRQHHTNQAKQQVARVRKDRVPREARVQHVTAAARSRRRPSTHGLPGLPPRPLGTPTATPTVLIEHPLVGGAVTTRPLPPWGPRAYPRHMWEQFPVQETIAARLEELQTRWQGIGEQCRVAECNSTPLHSCDHCYDSFRTFVTNDVTTSMLGAETSTTDDVTPSVDVTAAADGTPPDR
eukprot:m.735946 g.735946  ORF g.735946 m.735946 type:complete len:955 (-) comp23093_c0_seq17:188-3052(-)